MFIPDAEIQKFATQLIEIYGDDAYDFVYMHERHCSEIYEQVKWRKVGKAIRQKQPHLYG
ncbi:MAG: hypothetical protein COB24_15145 [Hyphomicrobiales bacterium]|nr:MAG: hypothetical protein COB24_15145 [Hyphomicrobiales bacterium]